MTVEFLLNGEKVVVDRKDHLHLSAAEYIREHAHCKSVKVGCAEGGCGACAVELVQQDVQTGQQSVLALNSCLLPVAALHGAHVITAAGLGSSRSGFHEVQRRLAGFHASQCGFCTPGMAVSTHAALMAAAHPQRQAAAGDAAADAAAQGGSLEQRRNGHAHNGCSGNGHCASNSGENGCTSKRSSSSSGGGVACAPSASDLLSALDGNLCRCTGWRPIADAAKSLCGDVDMEDLGLCSISKQQLGPLSSPQQLLPAVLQEPLPRLDQVSQQLQPGSEQQQRQFEAALKHLGPGSVLQPTSLEQLLAALAAADAAGVPAHLMGGNTGAGIYKQQWQAAAGSVCVLVRHVPQMRQLAVQHAGSAAADGAGGSSSGSVLLAGAGVTISQLLACLKGLAAAEEAAGRQLGARNLHFLWRHISRIAGTLVRNAATLGGHLALVRSQQLESDLLPMLVAAGAELQLAGADGSTCWMPVQGFASLPDTSSSSSSSVITTVRLPLPIGREGSSAVWSFKLTTHRHHNEHAAVNLCCWLTGLQTQDYQLRVAVGTYQRSSSSNNDSSNDSSSGAWRCSRATAVEAALRAALQQQAGLLQVLGQLPELLLKDITPAGWQEQYIRSVAPALLLKGLSVVLPQQQQQQQQVDAAAPHINAAMLAELRAAALAELAGKPLPTAQQHLLSDVDRAAPLHWPTEKEGAVLQASGEALYSGDEPLAPNALYAAYVTSQRAAGRLAQVDWQPALAVPGVVGWVGPGDIPAGPEVVAASSYTGPQEPLFAWREVAYTGQPLGLVLASSQRAAMAGAAAVRVQFEQQQADCDNAAGAEGSGSSKDTQESNSTADGSARPAGSAAWPALTNLADAVAAGSWYDISKLPANAAKGDVDAALAAASRRLSGQLQLSSQRHLYMEPQTAVATPGEGGSMAVVSSCQGCDQVLWAVARVLQLQHNRVHVTCRRVGGGFGGKADRAVFPAAAAAVAAHKFGRQVRLVVPGDVDGAMVAGRCPMQLHWQAGLDAGDRLAALKLDITCTGGAYFGGGIVEAVSIAYAADSVYDIPAFSVGVRVARCNLAPRTTMRGPGKVSAIIMLEHVMQQLAAAVGSDPASFRQRHMIQLPQEALAAAAAAAAAAADSSDSQNSNAVDAGAGGAGAGIMPHPKHLPQQGQALATTLGKPIELRHYTLPYMWQQVHAVYRQRRPAVEAFNGSNRLRKRGLAVVPIRYQLYHFPRSARVQIYADGSVLVSHSGTEMGQGIATKVKQAAAHALGQLLPDPCQRGELLQHIRVAGGCTELLPHAGLAAASTTSEGATVAVTLACEEVVASIKAQLEADAAAAAAAGGDQAQAPLTWQAAVKAVAPRDFMWAPKVVLSVAAIGSFGEGPDFGSGYHSFGAGLAEVELDVTTGERELRAVHLLFDAGRSINPAVDLGQVEGAFMQGVGHVLTEEVREDPISGVALSSSTWSYKPPGIAELPGEFVVAMLRDSPLHVTKLKQLSAKGTGEPPLMLAAAVACAVQDAVAAAWADHGWQGGGQLPVLDLPATTDSIKRALPRVLC